MVRQGELKKKVLEKTRHNSDALHFFHPEEVGAREGPQKKKTSTRLRAEIILGLSINATMKHSVF